MRLICLTLVMAVIGCDSGKGPVSYSVSGVVKVGGQPLAGANVSLVPIVVSNSTISSAGKTDASGRFSVVANNGKPGAVKGKYKLVLSMAEADKSKMTPEEYKKATEKSAPKNEKPSDKLKSIAQAHRGPGGPSSSDKSGSSSGQSSGAIPAAYMNPDTSPEEVEVVDRAITLDLDL